MANIFNVLKHKDTGADTLETIDISTSNATFALKTQNTNSAFIQMKITVKAGGDTVNMEISGQPSWSNTENEKVHFAQKDDSDNTLSKRLEVFDALTPDGGYLIPITYTKSIDKIIIYLEVVGVGQDTVLYIGAGFDSTQ